MVITRRPAPPASRHAAQTPTKVEKGKPSRIEREADGPDAGSFSAEEADLTGPQFQDDVLFSDGSPPRKSIKPRSKGRASMKRTGAKMRKRKQPSTWLDFFSKLFILSFLVYTLSVCPQEDKEKSPVCRALSEYRRLVVEPYVITPFQSLLHNPSVAPYALPVIENSRPVIARTQRVWNKQVIPQWNSRVTPLWRSQVVPRWEAHVTPHLNKFTTHIEPYRKVADETFRQHVEPHVNRFRDAMRKAQPYLLFAAAKTYDSYQASKPYISKGVSGLQKLPPFVVEYVINPLAAARRQFVDPHVALLIEKIKELSSGAANVSTGSLVESISPLIPVETKALSAEENIDDETSILLPNETAPVPATTSESTSSESEGRTIAVTDSPSAILAGTLLTPEASVSGATYSPVDYGMPVSVVSEPAIGEPENGKSVVQGRVAEQLVFSGSDDKETTPSLESSSIEEMLSPSEAMVDGTAIPEPSIDDNEIHGDEGMSINPIDESPTQDILSHVQSGSDSFDHLFESFDLDLDDDSDTGPPVVEDVSEADLAADEAARVEKVAAKRRDIEFKHDRWEKDLQEQMERQSEILKDAMQMIRVDAVERLNTDTTIRKSIDTVHDEAEKALKGLEGYLKKLKESGKSRTEQASLWERVLSKVEKKFDERLGHVEEAVNMWHEAEVLNKEKEQFEKSYDMVKAVADDAQSSLGMSYAWLEDVTTQDWKRYHKLESDAKEWRAETASLVGGTHEDAYPNPVLDVLNDLQAEVSDIAVGFQTRMRRVKREGERSFEVDKASAKKASPEVSILPVSDEQEMDEGPVRDAVDALLQRSQEEVVQAIDRLTQESIRAKHEEL